jgi:acetyltransferase-like isoleucine patch superfamily enzyme
MGLNRVELLRRSRVFLYRRLWTCQQVTGNPIALQPVVFHGRGRIVIGDGVQFGWPTSGGFYTGYCHVEATAPESIVEFEDGVEVNNGSVIKSEGPGIRIRREALIGSGVIIYDSDFHDLHPARRRGGRPAMAPVEIGRNAFIGDRAIILKGVTIGADAVVGAGSVVTTDVPAGVVVAGNPARVVRELEVTA